MATADYSDVEEYLEYLRAHGRRELTIFSAGNALRHMMDVLASDGRPTVLDAITLEDVRWLASNLHVKDSTRSNYIRLLSRMSNAHGGPDYGKQLDILYNRPTPDRCFITLDQFILLYKEAEPWDRLALVLGAFLGLRRSEICGLRDGDIQGDKVIIRGKGHGPDGLVVTMTLPPEVRKEIESFRAYKETHLRPSDDDHVYQVPRYNTWVPVEPVTLGQHMNALGRACGFRFSTHALRRLYATMLVNDIGAELDTVRRLMRHADISTTVRCYVAADPSKMNAAVGALMDRYTSALDGF